MSSPVREKEQPASFPSYTPNHPLERRSSDEDGTLLDDIDNSNQNQHLRLTTSYAAGPDRINHRSRSPLSPYAQQEEAQRLDDELAMLRAERVVSSQDQERSDDESVRRNKSIMGRSKSRKDHSAEPVDDFDIGTMPVHERNKIYKTQPISTSRVAKFLKKIHNSSFLIRYFVYITPLMALLLIPVLFGLLLFPKASVGGVSLFWFGIWLEIVWLTLWAARIIAKMIPYPLGLISTLFTDNSKKWRDLAKALEVPASLFFWWLAIEISFLPTMKNHHVDGNPASKSWEVTTNKVIIAFFVGFILNFVEKIIIQLIAISFHLRTYQDRIEANQFQIASLVKLYRYSKEKIRMDDSEFESQLNTGPSSGTRTPMIYVQKAQKNARNVFNKVGDVAGKVAGDFTGKAVTSSTHPHQVVLNLLNATTTCQVLARRLHRTFAVSVQKDDEEAMDLIKSDDLRLAFDNDEESKAAFAMFDRDLNGDISMEELEAVCVEIGRERKTITASLKDLDSVIAKLDDVLLVLVVFVTVVVFISLISASASTALTSLGSSVLALSWLFSATAQEFLQSLVFVFIKHPFDVGDRVTVYGNSGALGRGDDYFVKEISLLFTEFKKMEGHVVQAPNSYLNTLFILNQRRSGGLAEAVPVTLKFGTTMDQLEELRARLLDFVTAEKRDYQPNILTELTTVTEVYSITLNIVFFYKSNWQNELLRLQRRNKFICYMMVSIQELNIEGPRRRAPGGSEENPMYLVGSVPATQASASDPGNQGPGPHSGNLGREASILSDNTRPLPQHPSILRHRASTSTSNYSNSRHRGESLSHINKRVDFSLGMRGATTTGSQLYGDMSEKPKIHIPMSMVAESQSPGPRRGSREQHSRDRDGGSETDSLRRMESRESSNTGRKNRFFGRSTRNRGLGSAEEGTNLDDLEAGTREFSINDMPDIPEASGYNTAVLPQGEWGRLDEDEKSTSRGTNERIDPRGKIISPQTVAGDSSLGRGELPPPVRRAETEKPRKY